jgi:group I intron endonuclease
MIIYKITNLINKKVYIGQTTGSIKTRWAVHLRDSKIQKNNKFYNAIKKYGQENFKIDIIENDIDTHEVLNQRERYWIKYYDSYKNGYNSTFGGEESPMKNKEVCKKVSEALKGKPKTINPLKKSQKGKKGTPHTEAHKKYISEKLKNRSISEETRIKLRNANLGKKQSNETILKRSIAMKGKKFTEEHKKKISDSLKINGYKATGSENPRSKKVAQINVETNEIVRIFESASLAQEAMSKNKTGGLIIRLLNGKGKTAYGFKWKYIIELEACEKTMKG